MPGEGGYIKVSVLNENAGGIGGYGESECRGIRTDTTDGEVIWKQNKTLAGLKGRYIRLKFALKDAKIYSFWIE